MTMLTKKLDANQYNLKDQVVAINRVTKVVKGGKNMSFAALVVVGDAASGVVGYGSGKAKEVPQAIRKGIESAKKNLVRVNLTETTIPHQVLGRFGSGQVLLKPAPEGTGVIAGGAVRAVMTSVGVQNVLTKSLGSPNPHNVIKATFDALVQLRDRADVATMRGKTRGGAVTMAATKKIRIQYYRSKNSTPAKHKAGGQGPGLYAAQPDRRARGYGIDPGHGEGRAASGADFGELACKLQLLAFRAESKNSASGDSARRYQLAARRCITTRVGGF